MAESKILFVCIENAGRSQMAEGFFRKFSSEKYEPISAGTKPIGEINPLVVQVMKEVDVDISNQKPKILSDDMIKQSKRIVNMGCMDRESCPTLFVKNLIDWNIKDPKGKSVEEIRTIRDEIERKVKDLVANI